MRILFLALLTTLAAPALAQPVEDEAHRLDRLRTEALNRQAAGFVAKRNDRDADTRADYDDARAAYQRRLARWRAQLDACVGGDYSACDRR
jgi:hypothetical protein